jgi:asparagine synthase (glutamine-hydrolysing)
MCGICGVVQIGGAAREVVAPHVLDSMTDAMTHRGPNDRGTYAAPGVAFGVRRLSIVDVDGGHQPFPNEDGSVWGMQNGELYNHVELRRSLERDGHRFKSVCDTEILPHLYEAFGVEFERQLRGKFGLAVWDASRRRAVVARDPLGVKPVYWAQVGDLVVFASELKSLLASGLIEPSIDYAAIDAYLTLGYVPAPSTPLVGVQKLLPGHRLVIDPGGVRAEQYWAFPEPAPDHSRSEEETAEELVRRLEESVRLRLMSDVPLGAMLSGGLDSSLIVALMARNMSESVKTFSVGFAGAGAANELDAARAFAASVGADHHELELSLDDSDFDLTEIAWFMDEPVADLSSIGFLLLSSLAARHVTVALAGQGADELFGGYSKHQAASFCNTWERVPRSLRVKTSRAASLAPSPVDRMLRTLDARHPAERLIAMSGKIDARTRRRLFRGEMSDRNGSAADAAIRAKLRGATGDPLAMTLFLDGQMALTDDMLHYFDRASMARSLEVRVPFLDPHVVEFAATVPSSLKVKRLTRKYILRKAAQGLVPPEVIWNRKKIGFFNDSMDSWLTAQSDLAIRDWLADPGARYTDFLDRSTVLELVRERDAGDRSRTELVLAILMLEIWLSSFLPRAQRIASARERVSATAA